MAVSLRDQRGLKGDLRTLPACRVGFQRPLIQSEVVNLDEQNSQSQVGPILFQ